MFHLKLIKIYVLIPNTIQSIENLLYVVIREIISDGLEEENNFLKTDIIAPIFVYKVIQVMKVLEENIFIKIVDLKHWTYQKKQNVNFDPPVHS